MDFFLEQFYFNDYFNNLSDEQQQEYNNIRIELLNNGIELAGDEDLQELKRLAKKYL